MESIMDYMMNDFRIIYLCSRNHNESGCGSFFVRTTEHTELHGVLLSFSHAMSSRAKRRISGTQSRGIQANWKQVDVLEILHAPSFRALNSPHLARKDI